MLEFQIYDFVESHDISKEGYKQYIINVFGRCENNKSIYLRLIGFKPYFYILFPHELQKSKVNDLCNFKQKTILSIQEKILNGNKLICNSTIVESKKVEGFNDDAKYYFIKMEFYNYWSFMEWKKIIENEELQIINKKYKLEIYEADLSPMLRCFHINNIGGCSWVRVTDYIEISDVATCDISISTNWNNIKPIIKDINAPLKICSFDIECYSENGNFPKADKLEDKIIQIGYTYTLLGESVPYRKYIGCLDKTDKFDEETIVVSFKTEEELLLNFMEEITNNGCDIITGYNIYFFDEKYIHDRCELLNVDISHLSKLKNHKCRFMKEKKLASGAMGENYNSYWVTPGIIHIDLMKVVQSTSNLSSYTLDNVSSNYINGNIIKIKKKSDNLYILQCNNIKDILKGDWIHIEINKGVISENIGNKFMVTETNDCDNSLIIRDNNNELDSIDTEFKIKWLQAKDDITPSDIFNLYVGNGEDRSKIAKYCIKDCVLVNILINKLEVVSRNIEMANVCSVPLQYLFTRGQGVKIYSLCMKEFRIHGYIFPPLHYNKSICKKCNKSYKNMYTCTRCKINTVEDNNISTDNDNYEGAIVFNPIASVIDEAVSVKDYSSLYPSSIIQKNMSHETLLEDDKYLNLPYITYYTSMYVDNNGNNKTCKFAKKNNKIGVIPTILNNLLQERKNVKKKMKIEKDSFKYSILDAKQLALKITANSLYGQLGSIFSNIRKTELAACTTSTGREMLIFAKKYDEEILPFVMNTLKYNYKNNNNNENEKIYYEQLITNDDLKNNIKEYLHTLDNITIQPVIKYGDTDSIFSCYRFTENSYNKINISSNYLKSIIDFSYSLVEGYFEDKYKLSLKNEFDRYLNKITKNTIPILNNSNDNVSLFVKEYIEESYFPLLWKIIEIIEKDRLEILDEVILDWVDQKFYKYNFKRENFFMNIKNYLCNNVYTVINKIFPTNEYTVINISDIVYLVDNIKSLTTKTGIYKSCEKLLTVTIKNKWEYSLFNEKLHEIINEYLSNVLIEYRHDKKLNNIICKKLVFKKTIDKTDLDEIKENIILINNDFDIDTKNINSIHDDTFILKYNKYNGRKTMDEIIETFIVSDLDLDFNSSTINFHTNILSFVNKYLRRDDTNSQKYIYTRLHPRWVYDNDKKYIYVDIYEGGNLIVDNRTVELTIKLGKLSGHMIKYVLEDPHDCEYEKTYWPFIILTKKKYVGNKYENDHTKNVLDFTGIVLKRRDNAPIVKEICGGIINNILNNNTVEHIKNYTDMCLKKMFNNEYNLKYFLLTKKLKSNSSYKDWTKMCHMVLANRITERDPGNVIQSGSRLEYAFIKKKNISKKHLQGEIIESHDYIIKNNLEIDYLFYLKNQIMKPSLQFLELIDKNSYKIFDEYIEFYSKTPLERFKEEFKKIKKKCIASLIKKNKENTNMLKILTLLGEYLKNKKNNNIDYILNIPLINNQLTIINN